MKTREIALIAVFAALWIALQLSLGPFVGRLQLGPISMHGVLEQFIGWFLMVTLAEITKKFGRVTLMTTVAALGTRIGRLQLVDGAVAGLGFILGGILFDILFSILSTTKISGKKRDGCILLISAITGMATLLPYLLVQLTVLTIPAFMIKTPLYSYFVIKNVAFSSFGAFIALLSVPQVKKVTREFRDQ